MLDDCAVDGELERWYGLGTWLGFRDQGFEDLVLVSPRISIDLCLHLPILGGVRIQ